MLYLRRSRRGFTLIELMVVVAIIGVLALIGLRAYTGQMNKAKNAVVKANVGTVQTLIQANLADNTFDTAGAAIDALDLTYATGGIGAAGTSGMQNPYDETRDVVRADDTAFADEAAIKTAISALTDIDKAGIVWVAKLTAKQNFYIIGRGADGTTDGFDLLTAMR